MEIVGKVKNPHDKSEYVKMDDKAPAEQPQQQESEAAEQGEQKVEKIDKKNKPKYSGAYYYVDKDEKKLATMSFAQKSLTISSFLLQMVALIFPAQAGAMYVSNHIGSYALFYVVFVFIMFVASVWLMVMNQIRYKITKRITAEHAPKNGFKNRAYFGQELYMAVLAVMAAFQLSFVCIRFDGWGLGAFFVCLASLAAGVAARQITHITLKDAELISAPTESASEPEIK